MWLFIHAGTTVLGGVMWSIFPYSSGLFDNTDKIIWLFLKRWFPLPLLKPACSMKTMPTSWLLLSLLLSTPRTLYITVGEDRGVGGLGVRGSVVGGLLMKNGWGRYQMDGGRGQKIGILGRGTWEKNRKKGGGVGRKNLGGGGVKPGGRGSRPPCPPTHNMV